MAYDAQNIFAQMLRGDIPVTAIYEDAYALAFNDIAPAAAIHVLVIPKGDYASFDDFSQKATPEALAGFFAAIQKTAAQLGLDESGYRLIANHGADASQTVAHCHVHILGGQPLGGLLSGDTLMR
jgi:histidine triad (HIT) family protein